MTDYTENVKVVIDTDVKGDLSRSLNQIDDAVSNIKNAAESFEDLEQKVENVNDNLADGIDAEEIQNSLNELDDLEVKPKLASKVDASNKQGLKKNTNAHIREISEDIIDVQASLSGDPDIQTGKGMLKIRTNKEIRELNEGLVKLKTRIGGDVKWTQSGYMTAVGNYNTRIRALNESPRLKKLEPKISGDVNAENLRNFSIPDSVTEDIDEVRELFSSIGDLNDAQREAIEKADKLSEAKKTLSKDEEGLGDESDNTTKEMVKEAESFEDALDSIEGGNGLARAKRAAAKSNKFLSGTAEETVKTLKKEIGSFDELNVTAEELAQELGLISEAQREAMEANEDLADANKKTDESSEGEAKSFQKLARSASSVADMKEAARNANTKLSKANKKTADTARLEKIAIDNLGLSAIEAADFVEDLTDQFRESGESIRASSSSMRELSRRTDRATDSMRAASEVGEIFEDGLGSLSVNLGAFTVALRNFLTQVPLLLTALGAAGAAALGAASGFIALAGAMAGVVAAGALVHAQQLNEEFSELEGLGDSFSVVMQNVADTLLNAAGPLLENVQVIQFFKDGVQATAFVVNQLAVTLNDLTESSGSAASGIYSISDAMSDIREQVGPAFTNLVNELGDSFVILGEEVVSGTARATNGLANAVDFSTELVSRIEDMGHIISQFGDTIADLAILGTRIGGGLIPVFETFAVIMEDVAERLNQIDSQTVENAVTFLVMFAALNRVSGVLGSLLTILPNVAVGLAKVSQNASNATGMIRTFAASTSSAATQISGFLAQTSLLGGITQLTTVFGGANTRIREIAFNSAQADAAFDALSDEVDNTADELRQLAIQGNLADEVLEDLDEKDVDIDIDGDTVRAADLFDDMGSDEAQLDADRFLPDSPIMSQLFNVGDFSDTSDELYESVTESLSGENLREASESASSFKMFEDSSTAFNVVKSRVNDARSSIRSFGGDIVESGMDSLIGFGDSVGSAAKRLQSFRNSTSLTTAITNIYNASLGAAIGKLKAFIFATNASRTTMLKDAAAKAIGVAANFALGTAQLFASSAALSLAASLAVATGGVLLLAGIIGGLAVGIIANFSEIRSAAGEAFGFLKEILAVVADVLVTYFIESWNTLAALVQGLIAGFSPLINLFEDLAASVGLVSGEGDSAGGILAKVGAAGEFLKSAIGVAGTVTRGFISILSGVLTVATTLIRIGLTPLIAIINLLAAGFEFAASKFNALLKLIGVGGFGGLKDGITDLGGIIVDVFAMLPQLIEDSLNTIITGLNSISDIIPGLSELDTVDLTPETQVDRDELGAGTEEAQDFLASKGTPSIFYEENNEQNINQTINADPQDKSTVSRVVEDAIERANRFDRTRAGQ